MGDEAFANSWLPRLLALGEGPYLIVAVVLLIALEALASRMLGRGADVREEATSYGVGLGYFVITVLGTKLLFLGAYVHVHQHYRLMTWSVASPLSWLVLLLIGDFVYYWVHRMEHEVRFFWATHENHHSARTYTFGTAVRMPWGEVLYHPIIGFWAPLFGFDPIMLAPLGAFNLVCGLLQHTELVGKLGPLEWVFGTPSHHRVHHGSDAKYLDCNYGARLILWDRLFGTFREEAERPRYGLTKDVDSYNPLRIVWHGYGALWADVRKARSLRGAMRVLLKPPSYSPDEED